MGRKMQAPINTIKHYVHTPVAGIASGVANGFNLVNALAKGTARTSPTHVEEGAIIKAVYVEYWVKADNPNFTVNASLQKQPGGIASPTFAEMANMGSYANKKNVFDFHQGLAPSGDQVLPMFRGWYLLPKGKQRFGLGDILSVKFSFTGSAGDVCGFATFKEYE